MGGQSSRPYASENEALLIGTTHCFCSGLAVPSGAESLPCSRDEFQRIVEIAAPLGRRVLCRCCRPPTRMANQVADELQQALPHLFFECYPVCNRTPHALGKLCSRARARAYTHDM